MFSGFYFWPNLLNTTIRPDKEGYTKNPFILATHEFLSTPYPVSLANLLVLVGKQHEGQIMLGDELVVFGHWVAAHTHQDSFCPLKTSVFITERAGLRGSARRVVLGIKKQNKVLALKILECRHTAPVGGGLEGGRLVPFL